MIVFIKDKKELDELKSLYTWKPQKTDLDKKDIHRAYYYSYKFVFTGKYSKTFSFLYPGHSPSSFEIELPDHYLSFEEWKLLTDLSE